MIYGKYKIEKHASFPMYVIKPVSKGSIPKVLTGSYVSVKDATHAIDTNEAKAKGLRNAKAASKG